MATEPTKKPVRKTAARKPGARKATAPATAAPKAAAKPAAARKTAARKPAARKPAPQSTADKVRVTVTERVVKPARAAASTAYSAAQTAADTAREAASNAREGIASAASQGSSFGLKMIEHAEQNAREAFNAMRAAARSKDVSEVLKVQGEYLREQGARSLAQAREVGEMIAQFGRDAIAPLTGRKK